jgi:hypothetical protein
MDKVTLNFRRLPIRKNSNVENRNNSMGRGRDSNQPSKNLNAEPADLSPQIGPQSRN